MERLQVEFDGIYYSIIFDGTTRLGEATNVVGRFVTNDFFIKMRLLSFVTTEAHLSGADIYRLITLVLTNRLKLTFEMMVGAMHDSVAANGVAMSFLLVNAPSATNVLCFPHTIHNMGKRIIFEVLDTFLTAWLTGILKSNIAKALGRVAFGASLVSYSKVSPIPRFAHGLSHASLPSPHCRILTLATLLNGCQTAPPTHYVPL